MHTPTPQNKLADASSPYLLQHANNPVNWYPWGEEALQKARKENKLLLISIGYAACHWCHVMEKESFSDPVVAAIMNDHFINIKVDREERPDVDQVYMDALQIMTGQGGWPLNIVALPDQRPVFGGTYFPKDQWVEILEKISGMFTNDPEQFEEYAEKMVNALNTIDKQNGIAGTKPPKREELHAFFENFLKATDPKRGGLQGAPKFPLPVIGEAYLYFYVLSGETEALRLTCLTLDQMAAGGIYDSVGGGFSRYATDERWKVPHFEKMLYDNAQIVGLYANAYRLTQSPSYAEVIRDTFHFLNRELKDPAGGFYASLDADSEGEEGRFYIWTKDEFEDTLGEDAIWAADFFSLEKDGYWENGKNILLQLHDPAEFSRKNGWTEAEFYKKRRNVLRKLFEARNKRIRPATDDKVLTSWNAMLISGLSAAAKALNEENFIRTSVQIADFIRKHMVQGDVLYHNYRKGKTTIPGFLEDYACWIKALCDLYETTFDIRYLQEAEKWTYITIDRFRTDKSYLFFFTATGGEELVARKKETVDNVVPSSNSVMAENLIRLAHWFDREDWKFDGLRMLQEMKPGMMRNPAFHAGWGQVMCMLTGPFFELAASGPDAHQLLKKTDRQYLPVKVSALANEKSIKFIPFLEGKGADSSKKDQRVEEARRKAGNSTEVKSALYLCEDKLCHEPADNPEKIYEQVRERINSWQNNL